MSTIVANVRVAVQGAATATAQPKRRFHARWWWPPPPSPPCTPPPLPQRGRVQPPGIPAARRHTAKPSAAAAATASPPRRTERRDRRASRCGRHHPAVAAASADKPGKGGGKGERLSLRGPPPEPRRPSAPRVAAAARGARWGVLPQPSRATATCTRRHTLRTCCANPPYRCVVS